MLKELECKRINRKTEKNPCHTQPGGKSQNFTSFEMNLKHKHVNNPVAQGFEQSGFDVPLMKQL
jgi:hypothetical protein